MDENTPRATNMQAILNRLLDEAEGGSNRSPSPPSGDPRASAPPPDPPSAMASTPTATSAPTASSASEASAPPTSATAPVLGSLLSNPALLSALPVLLENLSPLMAGLGKPTGGAPPSSKSHSPDRHTALLCAIKPYLSAGRQEAAETLIRLCRIWDALERSGISLSGLLSSAGNSMPASGEAPSAKQEVT